MNCVVTAGPTFEPLDDVRRLTNFSTGKLGAELANHLVERGHEVTLLLGSGATYRGPLKAQHVRPFTTTTDLQARLAARAGPEIHAVFHAAAVNDFGFGQVFERDAHGGLRERRERKIPTAASGLLVELKPTPKVIAALRDWFPSALLVGWKYEADGDRDALVKKALDQIVGNRTDACVANGPAYGEGFGLVTPGPAHRHLIDAAALYAALAAMLSGLGSG
jgi:phosphopantothenate---cysteine ligase (CTP)